MAIVSALLDASLTTASASTDEVDCSAGVLFISGTISAGKLFFDVSPAGSSVNYIDTTFVAASLPNIDSDGVTKSGNFPFDIGRTALVKFRTSSDFAGSLTVSISPDRSEEAQAA